MCEFKYCCGTGKCFLGEASPCSVRKVVDESKPMRRGRVRSVRTSYPGFLDYEELMDVLDLADAVKENGQFESWFGAAPRFLRQAREAMQPKKKTKAA